MHGRLLVTAFSLGMIVPIMASSTAAWAADPGGAVVVRSGTVDQVVIDGLPGQDDALRTQTLVNVGGRMLDVPAAMGAGLRGGQAVSIRLQTPPGSGDAAALSQAKVLAVSASGTTVATSVAAAGAHTLTVLPVYWAAPDSATTASLTSLATGTAAYWAEQSDNQINISTSVQAWKKITNPAGTCNATALLNAALAANGRAAPTSERDHVLVYFPHRTDCAWAGLGSVNGPIIWDNGYQMIDVTAHEFGHNIGLGHANVANCTAGTTRVSLSATCAIGEYQDTADVMGYAMSSATGNLNTALADFLGLSTTVTASPTAPTTVDLSPLANVTATRSVRVDTSTGPVFIDFRPATGRDVRAPAWAGVQVHRRTLTSPPTSQLLNMQPDSATAFSNPSLPRYAVWQVPGSGLAVQVTQVSGTARIEVVPAATDTTSPTAATLISPTGSGRTTRTPAVSWAAAVDSGSGIAGYAVYLDNILNRRVAATTTSLNDLSVAVGSHTVRVDATDNVGNTTAGSPITFTAAAAAVQFTAPTLTYPTNGVALNTAAITAAWMPATSDEGLSGYRLSVNGVAPKTLLAADATGTPVTLRAGVNTLILTAVTTSGLTATATTLVTLDTTAPAAPTKTTVTDGNLLTWTATKDTGTAISYLVRFDDGATTTVTGSPVAAPSATGAHTYTVTARDAAGNVSKPVTAHYWWDPTPPIAPQITAPSTGSTLNSLSPTLSWTAGGDAQSGLAGYRMTVNGVTAATLVSAAATSAKVALRAGANTIGIAAVNQAGASSAGTTITVTADTTVPLTPTKPVLSAGDVLSWTAAKDIGTPVRFTVSLDGAAGTGTEGTSLPVTTPAGHHTWTITARDAAGNEARPATLSVWRDATPPTTPTITTPTTLSWVGVRSVAVAWAAATDADSGIAGYQLTINGVPAKTLLPATTLRTTVSLVEGINSIGVAAVNLAGVAGESGQISVGSDISAPTRPAITAPGAASTVGTSVTLTWTAAADPGSGVTGYLVSLNGRLVATLTAATLSYQVSGVSAKANTLSVVAVNAAGGKSAASTVAVTH